MNSRKRLSCIAALSIGLVAAQPPKDHPKPAESKSKDLNRLTADVASRIAKASNSAVPRRNFIDEFIFGKMERDRIPHAGLSSDTEFLRRIFLDLTGRLPEPETIRKFVADRDGGKRDKLIDDLMATKFGLQLQKINTPFLDRWTYFFGELFRNGTAQQGMGRNVFHDYLYDGLMLDVPYNTMVTEMITAKTRSNWQDGPSNFLVRDHVDGAVDFEGVNNEDSYDEMAITTTRLFLGVNLECVSCHDGKGHLEKINIGLTQIQRPALWRQASFFSKSRVYRPYSISQEFALQDDGKGYDLKSKSVVRMGRYAADVSPRFLLTGEKPGLGENWRTAYARMLTSHPQFARATVNLIWAELMGAGIVDPPFEFDLARQDPANPPPAPWTVQPTHPELLDALAKDFVEHQFSIRHLLGVIVKSGAYQLSAGFDGEWKEAYSGYFARRFVRRLAAEQVADAVQQVSGVFSEIPVAGTSVKVRYVIQTRSPEDLGGAALKSLRRLLLSFGQSNRDKGEKETAGSMVQSSVLMNSEFVKDKIRATEESRMGKLLSRNPPLSNEEIAEEMFLVFLSRFPDEREKRIAVETLQQYHKQGLEDLAWSLINKPEFLFNY